MRRWYDLFDMIRAARSHALKFGYGLKPYDDSSIHSVGFSCEEMHEFFQIDVMSVSDQLRLLPGLKPLILTREGRIVLSKFLGKGIIPSGAWEQGIRDLAAELDA